MRIQRSASSSVWPGSNGTSWSSKRPAMPGAPRRILSLAFKPRSPGAEADLLMPPPALARLRKIPALMRPAALLAGERGSRNALGDETHVTEVMQVDPFRIETGFRFRQLRTGFL